MLERLSFILGGPLTADRWQVEAVVKDRKVYVGCRRCFAEQEPQDGQELPKEELPSGRRWLRKLEKLGIQRWRSRFVPEEPARADTQWTLLYKEEGKPQRHITGRGAYPENWASFIDWLNELPGAAIRQENHIESVRFSFYEEVPLKAGGRKIPIREKLALDRRRRVIIYNRHKQELGTERHAYEVPRAIIRLLDMLDRTQHLEDKWPTERGEEGPKLEVRLTRHDGTETVIRCRYVPAELPENWPEFLAEIQRIMGGIGGRFFRRDTYLSESEVYR